MDRTLGWKWYIFIVGTYALLTTVGAWAQTGARPGGGTEVRPRVSPGPTLGSSAPTQNPGRGLIETCLSGMDRVRGHGTPEPSSCHNASEAGVRLPNAAPSERRVCEEPSTQLCVSSQSRPLPNLEQEAGVLVAATARQALSEINFPGGVAGELRRRLQQAGLPVNPNQNRDEALSEAFLADYVTMSNRSYEPASMAILAPESIGDRSFCPRTMGWALNDVAGMQNVQFLRASLDGMVNSMSLVDLYSSWVRDACRQFSSDEIPSSCSDGEQIPLRNEILRAETFRSDPQRFRREQDSLRQRLLTLIRNAFDVQISEPGRLQEPARTNFQRRQFRFCSYIRDLYAMRFRRIVGEFAFNLTHSRPFVSGLESRFMSPAQVSRARAMAQEIRQDIRSLVVQDILPRSGLQASQQQQILAQWDRFAIRTPEPVPEQSFRSVGGFPRPVTFLAEEEERLSSNLSMGPYFLREGLSGFLFSNGVYRIPRTYGAYGSPEHFELNPVYLAALSSHPDMLREVMAHELSHKFGPVVSATNGISLRPAYQRLFSCLSQQMGMHPSQVDETFADWLGTRAMVAYLGRLPNDGARMDAVRDAISTACHRLSEAVGDFAGYTGEGNRRPFDPHPEVYFRVNILFGRHPFIQGLLGCRPPAPYCGLNGEERL